MNPLIVTCVLQSPHLFHWIRYSYPHYWRFVAQLSMNESDIFQSHWPLTHASFSSNYISSTRVKGKLSAYTAVCKLFCRDHGRKPDTNFLSHFYRVLLQVCFAYYQVFSFYSSICCCIGSYKWEQQYRVEYRGICCKRLLSGTTR